MRYQLNIWGNDYSVSTEQAEKILGMKFNPVPPEMLATIYQAIELGHIPDPRKKMKKAKL